MERAHFEGCPEQYGYELTWLSACSVPNQNGLPHAPVPQIQETLEKLHSECGAGCGGMELTNDQTFLCN